MALVLANIELGPLARGGRAVDNRVAGTKQVLGSSINIDC